VAFYQLKNLATLGGCFIKLKNRRRRSRDPDPDLDHRQRRRKDPNPDPDLDPNDFSTYILTARVHRQENQEKGAITKKQEPVFHPWARQVF
jgi:hypothetical protein